MQLDGLAGKTALITGGSRGIGFAIAHRLVENGVNVCITARKADQLTAAVASLNEVGSAIAVAGKADQGDHQTDAVEKTIAAFGRLDILVNNAAVSPQFGPLMDADLGAVQKTLMVNVVATLAWSQLAWRAWMRDNGGSVVNVASTGGLQPAPSIGSYNVSKAALIHLTRQLALEMGPGVRVNALAPGLVRTQFAQPLFEDNESEVAALFPMKRIGEPGDIADAAAFLVSANASWMTGSTFVVDGGELTVAAI